jgi:hypothetical protein
VDVGVDESRQQCGAAAVDDLAALGSVATDAGDPPAVDDHGPHADRLLPIEDLRVGDRGERHGGPPLSWLVQDLHT